MYKHITYFNYKLLSMYEKQNKHTQKYVAWSIIYYVCI